MAEKKIGEIGAEVVCSIGNRFVLYKKHPKKPVIQLIDSKKKK